MEVTKAQDRQRFTDLTQSVRTMSEMTGAPYVYQDGVYIFHAIPMNTAEHGSRDANMTMVIDENDLVATMVTKDGWAYNLNGFEMHIADDQSGYANISLGDIKELDPRYCDLVNDSAEYVPGSFRIPKHPHADGTERLPVAIPGASFIPVGEAFTPIDRDERMFRARNRLANWFFPKANEKTLDQIVQSMEYHTNAFMLSQDPLVRHGLRTLYNRHIDALIEIKGISRPSDRLTLTRNYLPPLYNTISGAVNERSVYMLNPFGSKQGNDESMMEFIMTPLPWLSILRIPAAAWTQDQYLRGHHRLRGIWDKPREFCDVHVPIMHSAGLDQWLWVQTTSGLTLPLGNNFLSSYNFGAYQRSVQSFLSGNGWIGKDGEARDAFYPTDFMKSRYSYVFSQGMTKPSIVGPSHHYNGNNEHLCHAMGMRGRKMLDRIGEPQMSIQRTRGGMDNDTVKRKIRRFAGDYMAYRYHTITNYHPEHQLMMFYLFLYGGDFSELNRLIGFE